MQATVVTRSDLDIIAAGESARFPSSIRPAASTSGETVATSTTAVFVQPTTGGSALVLQCSQELFLLAPECVSNNDIACLCANPEFYRTVMSCISTRGSIDTDIQVAVADFVGMCTQWYPEGFAPPASSTVMSSSGPYATTSYPIDRTAALQGAPITSVTGRPSTRRSIWADESSSRAVNTNETISSSTQFPSRVQATTSTPYHVEANTSTSRNMAWTNSASTVWPKCPLMLGSLGILLWFTV